MLDVKVQSNAINESIINESIINDEPKLLETFGTGMVSHQGDLIIVGIGRLPTSAKVRNNRQLADGNTQGSRHVLVTGAIYDCDPLEVISLIKEACPKCDIKANTEKGRGENSIVEYIGPVFIGTGTIDLEHPEHGDQGFPEGQVCAVVYQRTLDSEDKIRRVRD